MFLNVLTKLSFSFRCENTFTTFHLFFSNAIFTGMHYMDCIFTKYNKCTTHVIYPVRIIDNNYKYKHKNKYKDINYVVAVEIKI